MRRLTLLLALLLALATPAGTTASAFPDRIDLPDDFAPEGIAVGHGHTFYTGSLAGAGIWRGDLRTGEGEFLVAGGGPFVGMDVDSRNRLWVAGGPAGTGHVFDADTGEQLATFAFATEPTFVNDVIVTPDAAYFTDSMQPAIYRVPLGADGAIGAPADPLVFEEAAIGFVAGQFNLNGIEATGDGATLIAVNSFAGALFAIDLSSGSVAPIDLGGASVSNGDGILLKGTTLYVVRNQLNLVAVVRLAPDLSAGAVVDELTSPDFDVPTTIARHGGDLYAVNARFRPPDQPPETEFWVSRVDR